MRKLKIVLAAVALAALIAMVNYTFKMDPSQLAARGVGGGGHDHDHEHEAEATAEESSPQDAGNYEAIGPVGAPVLIEVYEFPSDVGCPETWKVVRKVGEAYQPHVRVELRNLEQPQVRRQAQQLPLRGGRGLAVNGKVVVEVPGVGSFGMVVLIGGPYDRRWNEFVLRRVVERELENKGVDFTPPVDEAAQEAQHHGHTHEEDHQHQH